MLQNLANNSEPSSLANHWRKKRFSFFEELLNSLSGPIKLLDLGGTQAFWEMMEFLPNKSLKITLLNLNSEKIQNSKFESLTGDARNLSNIADKSFDIVFSNSVIEHVGDLNDQKNMANEICRVGKKFFIQTPNKHFPLEPHFLFPYFQFFPKVIQIKLLQNFNLGWYKKADSYEQAKLNAESVRLLSKRELLELFPGAQLYQERLGPLVKSYVAYGGW